MKTNWKDYLTFSRKERNGILVAVLLIAILLIIPQFFTGANGPQLQLDTTLQKQFEAFEQSKSNRPSFASYTDTTPVKTTPVKLFKFDPNTLDEAGFLQLGLPLKTARTLINYRNKGGHFYKPDDLRKIYSLSPQDADRLVPYVEIKPDATAKQKFYKEETPDAKEVKSSLTADFKVDINKATADEWKKFPGIGDALANRIVKFKYSKGGFTSVDDVSKTYGISDSLFKAMKPHLVYQP